MSIIIDSAIRRGRTLQSSNTKRILFYGACHATIFTRVFERYCTDFSYSFDTITNFDIIKRNIPFPYDRVSEWDTIVFSPILNQPGYETERLIDACIKGSIKFICYPHLHWRGYFPYIAEDYFIDMPFWHYPSSTTLAKASANFESYLDAFDRPFKDDYGIFENLETSTKRLREHEEIGNCHFIISDFIVDRYRDQRLFLTPGHPTQSLYIEAVRRLNGHLMIPLDETYYYSAAEPQEGVKVPIHPNVSARLGLRFYDADFQNITSPFGRQSLPWSDYMRLAYGFGNGSAMWLATADTVIKQSTRPSNLLAAHQYMKVPKGTMLQARMASAEGFHWKLHVTWAERSVWLSTQHWPEFYIYKEHWAESKIPS